MKHYLLTWYGITDLRSALGLEPTDGPILSALKTKKFTDVIILAYTAPGKSADGFTEEIRTEWEKWRTYDLEIRLQFPRDKAQQLVDAVSNTEVGHTLFIDWLKKELTHQGISCNIQVIPQELKHLNDTQAIYNAAASAIKLALTDPDEKTITTYVSPGTPVMAYTWALIARSHPQYNIQVIASSEPRNPPETLPLPQDLLTPKISCPQTAKPSEYDVIIHLLGQERMPVYFGMLQFKASYHIFVTTPDYQDAAHTLTRCLPTLCQSKTVFIQDPFTPAETQKAIETCAAEFPSTSRIAVNLTGGTKLMFTGALTACWKCDLEPFYFEINNHNIIFLRDEVTIPFIGAKSVTDFFIVNGFEVLKPGRWEDKPWRTLRLNATQKLWQARKIIAKLYSTQKFRAYLKTTPNSPFDWRWGNSRASFDSTGLATLILNGEPIPVPKCDDYGQYLAGGWLEEYVFSLLRVLEEKGIAQDLRIGMEVGYAEKGQYPKELPSGEFDCVFTDGKRLWIVECKAGAVLQEHIQKLENNLKTCGGIAAKGILVSSLPIRYPHRNRICKSKAIYYVHPEDLCLNIPENIISG